jgi:hypothetical protein
MYTITLEYLEKLLKTDVCLIFSQDLLKTKKVYIYL